MKTLLFEGVTIKETMGLLNCDAVSLYAWSLGLSSEDGRALGHFVSAAEVLDRKMQMLRLYTNRNSEAPLMMRQVGEWSKHL